MQKKTQERIDRIHKYQSQKLSLAEQARREEITLTRLYQIYREFLPGELSVASRANPGRRKNQALRAEIRHYHSLQMTPKEIAATLHITRQYVYLLMSELGLRSVRSTLPLFSQKEMGLLIDEVVDFWAIYPNASGKPHSKLTKEYVEAHDILDICESIPENTSLQRIQTALNHYRAKETTP